MNLYESLIYLYESLIKDAGTQNHIAAPRSTMAHGAQCWDEVGWVQVSPLHATKGQLFSYILRTLAV